MLPTMVRILILVVPVMINLSSIGDVNNANDTSIVTINAGAGDDTITFTMGSGTSTEGTITLNGGAGADTITGSVEVDKQYGGAGAG